MRALLEAGPRHGVTTPERTSPITDRAVDPATAVNRLREKTGTPRGEVVFTAPCKAKGKFQSLS